MPYYIILISVVKLLAQRLGYSGLWFLLPRRPNENCIFEFMLWSIQFNSTFISLNGEDYISYMYIIITNLS